MGVDQTSLDRIRNATFPSSKRGYDKQEVEKFLARLADWLETGGGDESRSETVKRELERVGERTGAILSQAEDSAQQIRAEAEAEVGGNTEAAARRGLREETRADADAETPRPTRDRRSGQDVADAIADAEAKAAGSSRRARGAARTSRRSSRTSSAAATTCWPTSRS